MHLYEVVIMISEDMIPKIKGVVKDFDNPIFQRYLKNQMACWHVCPVCAAKCENFTGLHKHIHKDHKEKLNTTAVKNSLNPLYRVCLLYTSDAADE